MCDNTYMTYMITHICALMCEFAYMIGIYDYTCMCIIYHLQSMCDLSVPQGLVVAADGHSSR